MNKRSHFKLTIAIKLLSPLSQIEDTVGNQANLRTVSILNGKKSEQVFAYSGNALRNRFLRRVGFLRFFERLGIDYGFPPKIHQTIFSGGFIDSSTAVDLDLDKKVRSLLPPLSVVGTAKPGGVFGTKTSQMIAGSINCGDAILWCKESDDLLARIHDLENLVDFLPDFSSDEIASYSEHFYNLQRVRNDSLKDSKLADYIDSTLPKGDSQQMLMNSWLIKPGSTLLSLFDGYMSNVEKGFVLDILTNLESLGSQGYLGGQNNVGCGLAQYSVLINQDGNIYTENDDEVIDLIEEYFDYVDKLPKDEIKGLLTDAGK